MKQNSLSKKVHDQLEELSNYSGMERKFFAECELDSWLREILADAQRVESELDRMTKFKVTQVHTELERSIEDDAEQSIRQQCEESRSSESSS